MPGTVTGDVDFPRIARPNLDKPAVRTRESVLLGTETRCCATPMGSKESVGAFDRDGEFAGLGLNRVDVGVEVTELDDAVPVADVAMRVVGGRSWAQQHLDRVTLVHRPVADCRLIQGKLQVEHLARIDMSRPDEVQEIRQESSDGCRAAV